MEMLTNEFAARPELIRRAIDQHTEWIEKSLGLPLSQAVIVGCDISFMDAAIPQLFGGLICRDSREEPVPGTYGTPRVCGDSAIMCANASS